MPSARAYCISSVSLPPERLSRVSFAKSSWLLVRAVLCWDCFSFHRVGVSFRDMSLLLSA